MRVHIFLCTLTASMSVVYTHNQVLASSQDLSLGIKTQAWSTRGSLRIRNADNAPFRLLPRGNRGSNDPPVQLQRQGSNGGNRPTTENPRSPSIATQQERSPFQPMSNALHRNDNFRRVVPQRPPTRNRDDGHIRQFSAQQGASGSFRPLTNALSAFSPIQQSSAQNSRRRPLTRPEAGSGQAAPDILTLPDAPQTPVPSRATSILSK